MNLSQPITETSRCAPNSSAALVVEAVLIALRTSPDVGSDLLLLSETAGTKNVIQGKSHDAQIQIAFAPRIWNERQPPNSIPSRATLVLGDPWEFDPAEPAKAMANAAILDYDLQRGAIRATSSIVALPALFLFRNASQSILCSDLYWLASVLRNKLEFDPEGIADLGSYGYPVDHRTLFRNVSLIPGGHSVIVGRDGRVDLQRTWNFPDPAPLPDWESYGELQISAFRSALQNMHLEQSFLSLTAGLDTRTIFSELMAEHRPMPAYTMSGESPSLDAQTARKLCLECNVPFDVVSLDRQFIADLPSLTIEASRLSGGLASLEQSSEVYLYKRVPNQFSGRLSGNIGNQIGRKGVEHISMRNAGAAVLNPELRRRIGERAGSPWYARGLASPNPQQFLLQHEVPYTSVGNYSIGNHFAVQQSPYANRSLFEICARRPADEGSSNLSARQLRINDLRHRFFGNPESRSFQRRLIRRNGGIAATYPINWGWRANGGTSAAGLARGLRTFADAFAVRQGIDSGPASQLLKAFHITGLHEFRHWQRWMKTSLRDFVADTLGSTAVRDSGIFDYPVLLRMLEEHYAASGSSHHRPLVFALDVALAHTNFCKG